MGLSKLSEKCRKCPFIDKCKNKQMEALAYISEPNAVEKLAAPVLRETTTIMIDGKPTTVYKDEIEKQIYSQLYSGLGLQFGG